MTENNNFNELKKLTSMCHGVPFGKLWSGATYGAKANIYRPTHISDMELSSTHYLLLELLNSLVTGDVILSIVLVEICNHVEKLRSRHYRVWLLEDFDFPKSDIQKAMALLAELTADGTLELPSHVMLIMTSLANKYGVNGIQLRTLSEEGVKDLANQLKNAVINNSPGDIIAIAAEGGDANESTPSGDSLIHIAAKAGKCASIGALNFLKVDLEAVNSKNATPLGEAVKNNHVSAVEALLKAGAKVEKRFYRGDTYLHIAATSGSNGVLEFLLDREVMKVNEKNHFGETPLVQAVKAGNVRGVEILLKKGADCSIVPEGGKSLTEMVLESQNPNMLRALVESGAELSFTGGDTILHLVASSGNVEMLNVIKNRKLPSNIKNNNGLTPLHVASDISIIRFLIRMGVDVNIRTDNGETALHLASAKGSLELVKDLVRLGVHVDPQDEGGTTPLMVACAGSKGNIVIFLLHHGANPLIKDKEGRTPLHHAAEGGCLRSVAALLDAGVKVDVKDEKGDTPAFVAALNNKPPVLKMLVGSRAADLSLRDCCGEGIIHRVAKLGHTEIITALLDLGMQVDMKGKDENSALHYASQKGHVAAVTALLDAGVEVDTICKNKKTALHRAVWEGHVAVATVLLDRGADLGARDVDGYTSLMMASNQGHMDVVQLLVDRGAVINERDNKQRTALYWADTNRKKAQAVAEYLKSIGGIQ